MTFLSPHFSHQTIFILFRLVSNMQILLDTSFILSCVRNKIDIFEEFLGEKVLIPKQVLVELGGLSKSKSEAKLALKILDKNKFFTPDLKTKNTDAGIKKYSKDNPETYVATLDRELKSKVKKKIFIRGKKKIEFD